MMYNGISNTLSVLSMVDHMSIRKFVNMIPKGKGLDDMTIRELIDLDVDSDLLNWIFDRWIKGFN